jgi:hypothetical protein
VRPALRSPTASQGSRWVVCRLRLPAPLPAHLTPASTVVLPIHPEWLSERLNTAAADGAGRRHAKNAAAPINQSREAHHSPEGAMRQGPEVRASRNADPRASAPGFLRASELGVSAMPTCIFAAHAGPSGAKLGGVTKANFFMGLRPPRPAIPSFPWIGAQRRAVPHSPRPSGSVHAAGMGSPAVSRGRLRRPHLASTCWQNRPPARTAAEDIRQVLQSRSEGDR